MSSNSNPFGGVSGAQASANLSAMNCPSHHGNAVPVVTLDGERVASLCPDCDEQLPADWRTPAERMVVMEDGHREDHHGHPAVRYLACRLCGEEG